MGSLELDVAVPRSVACVPHRAFTVTSRLIALTAIALATLLLAMPGAARAADPPTILTAGIDARDQLFVTWSLAPGTTYEMVEFATVPTADRSLPEFFADDNFAGFDSCDLRGCANVTSYTGSYPIQRDRRYFVKVTALDGEDSITSAVWVIDETLPVVPGDTDVGEGDSGRPATGRPFTEVPVPPGTAISLLTQPKSIAGLVRKGVRVSVSCPIACGVSATIKRFGSDTVVARVDKSYRGGGTRPFTLRVTSRGRSQLRPLTRTRLPVRVTAYLFDGSIATFSKTILVRR